MSRCDNLEVELKLAVCPESRGRLETLCKNLPGVVSVSRKFLKNIYFDTDDFALNKGKIALRVRNSGDGYVQTLKTQGSAEGAIHRRKEWEWRLDSENLQPSLLGDELSPGIDRNALRPVFETNFQRTTIDVAADETSFEIALDNGEVGMAERMEPLHELELELKQGNLEPLLTSASSLLAEIPMRLMSISKAERGYYLVGWGNHMSANIGRQPTSLVHAFQHWVDAFSFLYLSFGEREVLTAMASLEALVVRLAGLPEFELMAKKERERVQTLLADAALDAKECQSAVLHGDTLAGRLGLGILTELIKEPNAS